MESLNENGPTSSLWVQYSNMVNLMKKFIDSERRGDWDGHLVCVQQVINFFHASAKCTMLNVHYAKCTHISTYKT